MQYGNALMESKRDANSKVVRMALRPVPRRRKGRSEQQLEMKKGLLAAALFS
jgi:hypothetical protein